MLVLDGCAECSQFPLLSYHPSIDDIQSCLEDMPSSKRDRESRFPPTYLCSPATGMPRGMRLRPLFFDSLCCRHLRLCAPEPTTTSLLKTTTRLASI